MGQHLDGRNGVWYKFVSNVHRAVQKLQIAALSWWDGLLYPDTVSKPVGGLNHAVWCTKIARVAKDITRRKLGERKGGMWARERKKKTARRQHQDTGHLLSDPSSGG